MSIKHSGKSIQHQLRDFRAITKDLPGYIGTEAVRFFKGSFDRQGFIDESYERWKPRKAGARRNKGRKILVDRATLKRSIRITNKTSNSVTVGTNLPYARIHNEGGTIKANARVKAYRRKIKQAFGKKLKKMVIAQVREHTRKMNLTIPQRQYIGNSLFFERRMEMQLTYRIKQALGVK